MGSRRRRISGLLEGVAFVVLGLMLAPRVEARSWIELSPTGAPPSPRERHTAVYDPNSNRMIVFAGRDSGFNALDELWVLTHANGLGGTPNWTQLSPTGNAPGTRILHSAVYNPTSNRMIVFGGRDDTNSTVPADVWVLDHANGLGGTPDWTQLSPTGGPPSDRYRQSAVYDVPTNRMIVFGGAPSPYLNDVWVLEHADGLGGTPAWTALSPTGGPPPGRSSTSAVLDLVTDRMTVFAGFAFSTFNDTWVLEHANGLGGTPNWIELSPTGVLPTTRTEHTAVYDPVTNGMIVFGGDDSSGPLNELWLLTAANGLGGTPNWAQLSPAGGPPDPRILHTAIFDAGSNRMTVFGGANSGTRFNDVWVLIDAFERTQVAVPVLSQTAQFTLAMLLLLAGATQIRRLRRRWRSY